MKYDAIVIGTGQAGPSLAVRLAESGMKTAIIESTHFGGTCVNDGCTPTKTLVASAKVAHMARRASDYGIHIEGNITVDMKAVKARKDKLVKASSSGVEKWLRGTKNLTVYTGYGSFESANTVKVNDELLEAEKIFINVGGQARLPDYANKVNYLTNSSIMELDFIPEHLIIVGGSYIGLEFAQMYRRFGSEVTIIEMSKRFLPKEDEDIADAVQEILEKEGIKFRLAAECVDVNQKDNEIVVDVVCEKEDPIVRGSHILFAIGRTPNTQGLGLQKAGIQTDDKGFIIVNDELQTNIPHIWALGDCNGKGAFTHTAYNDYEIVAENLLQQSQRKVTDRIMCYAMYIDPALARIGMNEQQARESGKKVLIGKRPMSRIARAKEKGETEGLIKILVDEQTQQILGATILGIEGDEIIHSLLDVMYAKQPYTLITRAVHIHPTVSELLPTILSNLEPLY